MEALSTGAHGRLNLWPTPAVSRRKAISVNMTASIKELSPFALVDLNLRFGLADDGPNSWEYRRECYPLLLNRFPADFFTFQEANDFQIEYLQALLPKHRLVGQRSPAPPFWQNNVIFAHRDWHCHHQMHFFLSATPNIPSRQRQSRWPRQCTMGTFTKDQRTLTVVTTHFDFDRPVQRQSARIIMDRIDRLQENASVILSGDFNATPQADWYRLFSRPDRAKTRFKNIFDPPYPGTHHKFSGNPGDDHIDWILYRGDLVNDHQQVITDTFQDRYPSDHFPLLASFHWRRD